MPRGEMVAIETDVSVPKGAKTSRRRVRKALANLVREIQMVDVKLVIQDELDGKTVSIAIESRQDGTLYGIAILPWQYLEQK